MRARLRRLLKFQQTAPVSRRRGGYIDVPRKFSKIFTRTSFYLRKVNRLERRKGPLPVKHLQEIILAWSKEILGIIEIDIEIRGRIPDESRPVLFVGNHVSYVDIPLLMASVPVVFVSKEEVSKWLVIGPASKKAGTVFVKRESGESRAQTAKAIAACILERKQSVAIFPSGTTTVDEQKPWRSGAIKIAHKNHIPVQPFRITYEPLRTLAYIDDDFFPLHLWNLLSTRQKVKAIIEFGDVEEIRDPISDAERLRKWSSSIHKLQKEQHH